MNLHSLYPQVSYESFEKCLTKFLKDKFNVHKIVDTSYFRKEDLVGISSECPAVVLYIERVYPALVKRLSTHKTFQQIAADFINEELRNKDEAGQKSSHRIISIMQCYDKKDEISRDETNITHFIGTKELYEFIKRDFMPHDDADYRLEEWERTHIQKFAQKDLTDPSDGFLGQNPESPAASRSQACVVENQGGGPAYYSRTSLSIGEVCGLENCINIMNLARGGDVGNVELRICKNGCINGGAQVVLENLDLLCFHSDIDRCSPIYFRTSKRTFIEPKRRTFNIEW